MISQGIELLDKYYYDWMQGKYQSNKLVTDEQLKIILKIIECLGGVFGIMPTMEPFIPENMRPLFLERLLERNQKEIDEITRNYKPFPGTEDWERKSSILELIKDKDVTLLTNWKLSQIPTTLKIGDLNGTRRLALRCRFSTSELGRLIQWRVAGKHRLEKEVISRMVRLIINGEELNRNFLSEFKDAKSDYGAVMVLPLAIEKFGENYTSLPYETTEPYMLKVAERVAWQVFELSAFCLYFFRGCPEALQKYPLKVPSGHYEESPKREQTQRELIDKMAQELSSLPRFHAWTKTLAERYDGKEDIVYAEIHKVRTLPSKISHSERPRIQPYPLEKFCKLRSEIEEEIAERQAMWKRGLSSPPAEKKTEKKADTAGKPPPTTTSG